MREDPAAPNRETPIADNEALPVLDAGPIEEMKTLEAPGIFSIAEIIDIFTGDTRSRLDAIAVALRAKNASGLQQEAHTVKGSCLEMGAKRLAETCLELEICGKNADFSPAEPLIKRAEREYAEVCVALARYKKTPEESADPSGGKT